MDNLESPPCKHATEHDEHTVWPIETTLDHFDHCLTPEQRADRWADISEALDHAAICWRNEHVGRIADLEHALTRASQLTPDAHSETWQPTTPAPAEPGPTSSNSAKPATPGPATSAANPSPADSHPTNPSATKPTT